MVLCMGKSLLTRRQKEIVCLVANGMQDKEIAEKLGITRRTLEMHIIRIRKLVSAKNRVQLVRWVYGQGWVAIIEQQKKATYKSLLAALALSPSNKAIMVVSQKYRLIIERHWTPTRLYYSIHLVDMAKKDIAYATGAIDGLSALQEWAERINDSLETNIDIAKKRWLSLEEAMLLERDKNNNQQQQQ